MSELKELIPILLSKTKDGKLSWQLAMGELVWVKLGQSLIEINGLPAAAYNENSVDIRIRNPDGSIIDEFSALEGTPFYTQLSAILNMARRSALKVDEALSEIMAELERL